MQIEVTNPEIISQSDYQPTEIPNLFIHAGDESLVVVGLETAYRIKPAS